MKEKQERELDKHENDSSAMTSILEIEGVD